MNIREHTGTSMVRSALVLYSIHCEHGFVCKTEIVISIWQHFRSEERQTFLNVLERSKSTHF